jgi:dTDP-4-amino-4,6-dideoxyglucose
LASRHGLKLAFDAAHAIGCTVRGRRIGGFGDAEVFSFHATKILNGAEGGCIATDDDQLAETLRAMRSFHDGGTAGGAFRLNAKISEAQAAMALLGLRHLDGLIEENRHRYELYRHGLRNVPGLQFLDYAAGEESNYQFIVASISPTELGMTRDDLLDGLQARGILARRYFSPGIHRTSPFRDGEVPDLPVTDHLCRTLLQLPTGQAVSDGDVAAVCAAVHTLAGTVTP